MNDCCVLKWNDRSYGQQQQQQAAALSICNAGMIHAPTTLILLHNSNLEESDLCSKIKPKSSTDNSLNNLLLVYYNYVGLGGARALSDSGPRSAVIAARTGTDKAVASTS